MTGAWHELTALQQGAEIRAGRLDPVALAEHYFDRIAAADPDLVTYVSLTRERAYIEAMAARRRAAFGQMLSALDGVPISWKDLYDTAGHPTEGASALFKGRVPEQDAVCLARATRAGMVCLGKTNMPDLAFSGLGVNPYAGTPVNPHSSDGDPRVPGGSSSGAGVSVAAGLAAAGIGSDTGGSVRIPAAYNGVVGLKTTWGAISLEGVMPLAPSLDTVGPLTQDVADANALFAVLSGRPASDLRGANAKGLRLLWARGHDAAYIEPGVASAIEGVVEALRQAGATVDEARLDSFDSVDGLAAEHGNPIVLEGWALWGPTIEARPDDLYGPIRERIAAGREASATDSEMLRHRLGQLQCAFLAETAAYDAVLCATIPVTAPSIEAVSTDAGTHNHFALVSSFNTRRANFLGLCALSIPCGSPGGLPAGLMLIGAPNSEARLCRTGAAVEGVLN